MSEENIPPEESAEEEVERVVQEAVKAGKKKSSKQPKQKKLSEVEELKQQCGEYLAGWQRAQADYANLQKETQTRIGENIKYATESFLQELLPIVDHFKYAFNGIPEEQKDSGWLKGIEHIQTNFHKVLEEHGLELIPTVGEQFDAQLHEAVEEVDGEGDSGVIAAEVSSGFKLNGKVIQCAKVKVNK